MMTRTLWLLLLPLIYACNQTSTPKSDTPNADVPVLTGANKFSDDSLRIIYTFQDERDSLELLPILQSQNATYREAAAKAFGSFQAMVALPTLINLLQDDAELVRNASAYALGQMRLASNAQVLIDAIEKEPSDLVTITLLEALGKCAAPESVQFLATFYGNKTVEYGVALGLFRAAIQKQSSEAGLARVIQLMKPNQQDKTRVIASTYLARNRSQNIDAFTRAISLTLRNDNSPYVRMNCARALSKAPKAEVSADLAKAMEHDENHLVKVNALRAANALGGDEFKEIAFRLLKHKNEQVAVTASEFIKRHVVKKDQKQLKKLVEIPLPWLVNANLLEALISVKPKTSKLIIKQLNESNNKYEQGALLKALAANIENYGFIKQRLFHTDDPIIKSYAIEALVGVRLDPLYETLRKKHDKVNQEFAEIVKFCINDKDVGLIYHAANLIRHPKVDIKDDLGDFSFMVKVLTSLQLPRDIEAYEELAKTLDYLKVDYSETKPTEKRIHAINWEHTLKIAPKQTMKIITSKGDIILQLMVEDAPGTVNEITSLVQQGFYDGRSFHRIVPNFVAQGGCPRGDGFGGLTYTLRSELSQLYYQEGYVGMARSSNTDTESCQWFITHSPTPHLDGQYTIFAKVISGMPIVQRLGVGDIIEHIELPSN